MPTMFLQLVDDIKDAMEDISAVLHRGRLGKLCDRLETEMPKGFQREWLAYAMGVLIGILLLIDYSARLTCALLTVVFPLADVCKKWSEDDHGWTRRMTAFLVLYVIGYFIDNILACVTGYYVFKAILFLWSHYNDHRGIVHLLDQILGGQQQPKPSAHVEIPAEH